MTYVTRLEQLRQKHGRDRSLVREFPDLTVEQNCSPVSNRFDKALSWKKGVHCSCVSVGCLHKSSYQVLIPGEEKFACRKI